MEYAKQKRCEETLKWVQSYLKDRTYPLCATESEKRLIRKRSTDFSLSHDDVLLYVGGKNQDARVVLFTEEDRTKAFSECHASKSGGHLGRDRTEEKLRHYYWPHMHLDIRRWVTECDSCQRTNHSIKAPHLPLQPSYGLWNLWGVDLIGPLTLTPRGNRYIIVATDYFSKWPEAAPLQNKEATTVAHFMYSLYCRFGASEIITDQGREFINEVVDCLCKKFEMDHRMMSAYHPQSNGLCEKMNQTIIRSLEKCVNDCLDEWDQSIESVLFAIRTSPQSSTKFSPYEVAYGRKVTFPIEHAVRSEHTIPADDSYSDEKHQQMLSHRSKITQQVKANITKAQTSQIATDLKRKGKVDIKSRVSVGDKVLVRNRRQESQKGGKLTRKYLGPFTVKTISDKGQVGLINNEGKNLKTKQSIRNIKKYIKSMSCSPSTLHGKCIYTESITSPPEQLLPVTTSPPEQLLPVTTSPPEQLLPVTTSPPEQVLPVTNSPPEQLFPVKTMFKSCQ